MSFEIFRISPRTHTRCPRVQELDARIENHELNLIHLNPFNKWWRPITRRGIEREKTAIGRLSAQRDVYLALSKNCVGPEDKMIAVNEENAYSPSTECPIMQIVGLELTLREQEIIMPGKKK